MNSDAYLKTENKHRAMLTKLLGFAFEPFVVLAVVFDSQGGGREGRLPAGQTSEGSFSIVSRPNFTSEASLAEIYVIYAFLPISGLLLLNQVDIAEILQRFSFLF